MKTLSGLLMTTPLMVLPITISCSGSESSGLIDSEIEHIQTIEPTAKNPEISQADFDAITESNVLDQINVELNKDEFDYQVVEFKKTSNQVAFKIKVSIKGTNNFQLVDKQFSVTFNVQAPAPQYQFTISPSNVENIISYDRATINFVLNVDQSISESINLILKLDNNNSYEAKLIKISKNNWTAEVSLNNLNKKTKYSFVEANILVGSNEYQAKFTDQVMFTTLNNVDSVKNVNVKKTNISDGRNIVTIELDQLLPENYNKSIKVAFVNQNQKFFTNVNQLNKNKLIYDFEFNDLTNPGKYIFEGVYLENDVKLNSLFTNEVSFNVINNQPTPENNFNLEEYGNFYGVQTANKYFDSDKNINIYQNDSLSRETLITKNKYYQTYFGILDRPISKPSSHDHVGNDIDVKQGISINSINVDNSNKKIVVSLNNINNINLTAIKFLVKTYDQDANWSKWIEAANIGNNQYEFSSSLLNQFENKYVITNLISGNETYNLAYKKANLFTFNQINIASLDINNFDVYKDQTNKKVYGSIMFNWDENQAQVLSDKVFALTFKITRKIDWEKFDPLFGGLLNPEDDFNEEYAFDEYKKIYIPFNQLHKFSMDSFIDGIEYTLASFQIVNNLSYLDFSNSIDVSSKKLSFVFNLNWSNQIRLNDQLSQTNLIESITKKQLDELTQKQDKTVDVQFSIRNFNTILDYLFDVYNHKKRYPNSLISLNQPRINIYENNIKQNIKFFMPRELLVNTIFNINENANSAIVSKNLNSLVGLNQVPSDKLILWITFELDLNTRKLKDFTECNNIHSRIRIPVSLANLKPNQTIENVDFMFDSISGTKDVQQKLYNKIKSKIKFNISLTSDNQLKVSLHARDKELKFNNKLWLHNSSLSSSAFISNSYMFVNWVQPESISEPLISYLEQDHLDSLTIQSDAIAFKDSYDIKFELPTTTTVGGMDYANADNILDPNPGEKNVGKRLFKDDNSVGINQARSRIFSLNKKVDGTWNIFAKVNNDPNDHRFYAIVNYHVWKTNRDMTSDPSLGDNYLLKTDENGHEYIEIKNPSLMAPTLTSKNDNNKTPIYFQDYENPEIPVNGNCFDFEIGPNKEGIKYSIFMSFIDKKIWGFDSYKDNVGIDIKPNDNEDNLDMIVAIVDFSPVFNEFDGVNLDSYLYKGRNLTVKEKNAIKYYLNFKNLKPLKISQMSYYINSFSNLNFYLASFPKNMVGPNLDSSYVSRYREYLIANNSTMLSTTNDEDQFKSKRPVFETEARYFDIYNGSSGSGVYDHLGNLVAIDTQGHPSKTSNYSIIDTQRFSFLGNEYTRYNPYTFFNIVKKMSYLYPYEFSDIFKI